MFNLDLPSTPVPARWSLTRPVPPNQRTVLADLEGPGCIRHLWMTLKHPGAISLGNRKLVLRITFDDAPVPQIESPVGDFFGLVHGQNWYDINTPLLSTKAWSGMNCYFPMPFARSARIEVETGDEAQHVYLLCDWHRYPGQELREPKRFCARWRREMPTERYGPEYLLLDADGPGQFVGFVYGVRLLDDVDRWSHGGGDNFYIDGEGEHPAYLRGIGGEDTFGAGYGGALHPPETHHHAAMPYYTHEDTGEARPAQRIGAYRFFIEDTLPFRESIHVRFGCMRNDICSTAYWYQEGPVRPFFRLPPFPKLLPAADLPRGACDLPLPDSGSWWICGPFAHGEGGAMQRTLGPEAEFDPAKTYDPAHAEGSWWLTDGSRAKGYDVAKWSTQAAFRGWLDFNHAYRPWHRGVGVTYPAVALARATLHAPRDLTATLRLGWDDDLTVRVNGGEPIDLGHHADFRSRTIEAPLRQGPNTVLLKSSNTRGSTHGGWAVSFLAQTPEGDTLRPQAER